MLNALTQLKEVLNNETDSIIGVSYNNGLRRELTVHIDKRYFKEIVTEELNIDPLYVVVNKRDTDSEFIYEVATYANEIKFFSVLTEKEYYNEFDEWINLPFADDEELEISPISNYEKMKDAGHKLSDFM